MHTIISIYAEIWQIEKALAVERTPGPTLLRLHELLVSLHYQLFREYPFIPAPPA